MNAFVPFFIVLLEYKAYFIKYPLITKCKLFYDQNSVSFSIIQFESEWDKCTGLNICVVF